MVNGDSQLITLYNHQPTGHTWTVVHVDHLWRYQPNHNGIGRKTEACRASMYGSMLLGCRFITCLVWDQIRNYCDECERLCLYKESGFYYGMCRDQIQHLLFNLMSSYVLPCSFHSGILPAELQTHWLRTSGTLAQLLSPMSLDDQTG